MNQIDETREHRATAVPSRALSTLAAGAVVVGVLFITLVATPSPAGSEPSPEPSATTFLANSFVEETFVGEPPPVPSALAASSLPPSETASPPASPPAIAASRHVATRVRVPDLRIDLAVIAQPKNHAAYPLCGVAMYLTGLHQPGQDGATYLYAHAREGMFLPIYEHAIQRLDGGPRALLGLSVEVFTSDDLRYRYKVTEVRLHQTSLADAARARSDEVWLQTSEGPRGTRGKTQLRAMPVDVQAVTHLQAHPVARPVTCG